MGGRRADYGTRAPRRGFREKWVKAGRRPKRGTHPPHSSTPPKMFKKPFGEKKAHHPATGVLMRVNPKVEAAIARVREEREKLGLSDTQQLSQGCACCGHLLPMDRFPVDRMGVWPECRNCVWRSRSGYGPAKVDDGCQNEPYDCDKCKRHTWRTDFYPGSDGKCDRCWDGFIVTCELPRLAGLPDDWTNDKLPFEESDEQPAAKKAKV
eukprot:jgi/Mesvir1/18490/Mv14335-RA.1